MVNFKLKLVDTVIEANVFYESTKRYCKDYLCDDKPDYVVTLTEEDLKNEEFIYHKDGYVYQEIAALHRKIADILIDQDIIVFHSSAFMVNGYAFLLAARSGTGKTTHARLLSELLKDKFKYINDDKPLVEVKDDITVYSSPWNGKERRGNNISAPLSTVIFLSRGIDNKYKKINNKDSIYTNLLSQIYLPTSKTKREKALKIIDILLEEINYYEINVNMDISAAKMTYERIIRYETEQ